MCLLNMVSFHYYVSMQGAVAYCVDKIIPVRISWGECKMSAYFELCGLFSTWIGATARWAAKANSV